jgi:hypothetical protein
MGIKPREHEPLPPGNYTPDQLNWTSVFSLHHEHYVANSYPRGLDDR